MLDLAKLIMHSKFQAFSVQIFFKMATKSHLEMMKSLWILNNKVQCGDTKLVFFKEQKKIDIYVLHFNISIKIN